MTGAENIDLDEHAKRIAGEVVRAREGAARRKLVNGVLGLPHLLRDLDPRKGTRS